MIVEINGVKYQEKEQPQIKPISKTMLAILAMASAFREFDSSFSKKQKEQHSVDIVKEYGLIQQKKSNLSKSQRDYVVCQFEKNFERIY